MKPFNTLIENLRSQSPKFKGRVIFSVFALSALALGSLWINDMQKTLGSIDSDNIFNPAGSVLSATNFITIESMEEREGKTYVYFRVDNNNPDILNFPTVENIKLKSSNETSTPESITDRQGFPFIRKALTNTTHYGILTFGRVGDKKGTLTIDNMFFEQSQTKTFRQEMEIDFTKLQPQTELRS